MKSFYAFILALIVLLALTLVGSHDPTAQAQVQLSGVSLPCSCADKQDLTDRYYYDLAAAQAYRDESDIEYIKWSQAFDKGNNQLFNQEDWARLQNLVNASMKRNFSGPSMGTYKMDGDCDGELEGPTTCLRALYQMSRKTGSPCELVKNASPKAERMTDVAAGAANLYREQAGLIDLVLGRLPNTCKSGGWSGQITYSEIFGTNTYRTIPPVTNGTKGGYDSGDSTTHLNITINVRDDVGFFAYDYQTITNSKQEITSLIKCHSNEKEFQDFTHHTAMKVVELDRGFGKLRNLKINLLLDGSYSVSFTTAKVEGTYTKTPDVTPPPCGAAFTQPQALSTSSMRGEFSYSGHGKTDDQNGISGGEKKSIPNGGITVTWNLRRAQK